jgi:hypothetical protein
MKLRLVLPLVGICLLCVRCGGGGPPPQAVHAAPVSHASGFASARARLGGMKCASIGLHGGAAIGHYSLYVCAGPDHAGIGVPSSAFVCWGFHDFGLGRDQPAVELNIMDPSGRTIGGHLYPDTAVNCRRTLKVVAGLL